MSMRILNGLLQSKAQKLLMPRSAHLTELKRCLYNPRIGINRDTIAVMQQRIDLWPSSIKRWWMRQKAKVLKQDHGFIKERHRILGPDLATAHFTVARGASVKFLGYDRWIKSDDKGNYVLPRTFKENMFLEAVDARGTDLMYESFDNFIRLEHLKYLNLSGCLRVDDWCLDRLSQFSDTLVYLDISECPQITERGLACLHRLRKLRRLKIENLPNVENLPLVAILLEEAMPQCYIEGVDYTDTTLLQAQTAHRPDPILEFFNLETKNEVHSGKTIKDKDISQSS